MAFERVSSFSSGVQARPGMTLNRPFARREPRSPMTLGFRSPIRYRAPSFHQIVHSELGRKTNWPESGDLSMMFRGAFSTELYRALADAIHVEVRSPGNRALIASAWAEVDVFKSAELCALGGGLVKLLLTHAYFLFEDAKEQQIMKPYAPLGLLYLSSRLRKQGFAVDIYDSTFGSKRELFDLLRAGPPATLGVYANLITRLNALEIIDCAREAGWNVIVGGPEPANYPEQYLDSGADVVIVGEGELALESLLSSNFDRTAWAEIGGLIFRGEDGRIVRTPSAPLIKNLDAQPWPDRERIDMHKYLETWRTFHGKGSVSLITARGCPYRCNWCSHSVYGTTHRRQAVVSEIEWILERYNPELLWLADDVFTIHHGWLFELRRR